MIFSPIVDTAISLLFLLLLCSLAASFLQEAWSSWANLRGKLLKDALTEALDAEGGKLSDELYQYPLIGLLLGKKDLLPNYLSPKTFARTMIAVVADKNHDAANIDLFTKFKGGIGHLASKPLQKLLEHFVQHAANTESLEGEIKLWFDQLTQQTSGRYKKRIQKRLLIVSCLIAVGGNFSLFSTISTLYHDSAMRSQWVSAATQYTQAQQGSPSLSKADIEKLKMALTNTPLPIGWDVERLIIDWHTPFGWLASALLISFGAPFWFDLLSKLINLRASAAKPDGK